VVSIRSTMSRAAAATSSHATRAPADGPTVRTASAHPTTASAVGSAVSATRMRKIHWRNGSAIFDGAIWAFGVRVTNRHGAIVGGFDESSDALPLVQHEIPPGDHRRHRRG